MMIVMNPPYGGNLHLKILDKMLKSFEKALIISLQPVLWLEDYGSYYDKSSLRNDAYKDAANSIYSLDVILREDSQEYFKSRAPTDLGIYVAGGDSAKTANLDPLHIRGFKEGSSKIVEKVLEKAERFSDKIVWNKPLKKYSVVYSHMCGLTSNSHNFVYVDGKAPDGTSYKENVKNQHKNDFPRTHFEFDTYEEAENFRKYLFTKTFKFVEKATQPGTLRNLNTLPFMPTYKYQWTDEMLYKYFGLTDDEVNIINRK